MKKVIFISIVLVVLLTACSAKTTPPEINPTVAPTAEVLQTPVATEDTSMMMKPKFENGIYTFHLDPQNDSGQSGTATLEEIKGKVKVTLALENPNTTPQPAHIHLGKCPTPGDVKYPLTNVVNGKSETTVNTTMSALMKLGDLAINVHKSAQEVKTYVSCTDLSFTAANPGASAAVMPGKLGTTSPSDMKSDNDADDAMPAKTPNNK